MNDQYLVWTRDADFVESEAYRTDDRLVRMAAPKGYRALIEEYVYIDSADVVRLFPLLPGVPRPFTVSAPTSVATSVDTVSTWR